jgi:hypothetical protein
MGEPEPIFSINYQEYNTTDCRGEDCDRINSLMLIVGHKGAPPGIHPSTIVCKGLRALTTGERQYADQVGWPFVSGKVCNLKIRYVVDPFTGDC